MHARRPGQSLTQREANGWTLLASECRASTPPEIRTEIEQTIKRIKDIRRADIHSEKLR